MFTGFIRVHGNFESDELDRRQAEVRRAWAGQFAVLAACALLFHWMPIMIVQGPWFWGVALLVICTQTLGTLSLRSWWHRQGRARTRALIEAGRPPMESYVIARKLRVRQNGEDLAAAFLLSPILSGVVTSLCWLVVLIAVVGLLMGIFALRKPEQGAFMENVGLKELAMLSPSKVPLLFALMVLSDVMFWPVVLLPVLSLLLAPMMAYSIGLGASSRSLDRQHGTGLDLPWGRETGPSSRDAD